ncbi:hypothetical protein EB796_000634 [Bugula neritina]|uniref:MADF domain-containing protein n=1 Tax=Bugula neritina TaxID=10212 RepID=A0A7J7KS64_BUGNE|nr:hypothetical protein EB796_000634 [Bugula neritina]
MEQIRQYPELYDKSNTLFKDKDAKYQAWKNIATALSTTEDFAKTRYNTIRTRLTKYLGKLKSHHGSVAAGTAKPSFESLRWLYPHIEHRHVGKRPSENGELNNDVVESDNETNSIVAAMASKLTQKDKKLKKELLDCHSL